jgi:hypothetical protein
MLLNKGLLNLSYDFNVLLSITMLSNNNNNNNNIYPIINFTIMQTISTRQIKEFKNLSTKKTCAKN